MPHPRVGLGLGFGFGRGSVPGLDLVVGLVLGCGIGFGLGLGPELGWGVDSGTTCSRHELLGGASVSLASQQADVVWTALV